LWKPFSGDLALVCAVLQQGQGLEPSAFPGRQGGNFDG